MDTQFQDDPVAGDTVAQLAAMISKFSRLQSINANVGRLPVHVWGLDDERTLLLAAGLFAIADQLQRVADALTVPEPPPLAIPTGDDDAFLVAD
jgi:hypothetical protein